MQHSARFGPMQRREVIQRALVRVNVGCGQTPTEGWTNLDNSPSVRIAKYLFLPSLLRIVHLIAPDQYAFTTVARARGIEFCDVTRGLPFAANSVDVVYSSHMLEHLDRKEAAAFLEEAMRVLRSGGHLRLAVPDLRKLLESYLEERDADAFMSRTHTCQPRPSNFRGRLRQILVGARHHHWMYDARSLERLLTSHGFVRAASLPPGETRIPEPGALDLAERAEESLYAEAIKP